MLVASRPDASRDSVVLEFQAMLKRECFHYKDVAYYAPAQGLTPRYFTTIIREMTGKSVSHHRHFSRDITDSQPERPLHNFAKETEFRL